MRQASIAPVVRLSLWLTIAALTIRLISLGLYPLMDTTETRYGEIARIMAETGNWVTLQLDYNVPFWGKPPLYSWITATSFDLLGVSEFSARLPHFLTGILVICLIWTLARRQNGLTQAALATVALSTTAAFIISIGAVMTDTVLLLGVTLTMTSFWLAWHSTHRKGGLWGYLFFIGLAIGLLAKGPVVWILTGIPVFLWCLPKKRLITLWQRLPWVPGVILMLAITLPWYILAEMKTPGFLDYFIVGEHFRRFVISGWEGDLYGTAHVQPKGSIWLMWLYAALPWNVVLPFAWWKNRQATKEDQFPASSRELSSKELSQNWRLFLWCWMLSPMLFFTLAGNILWTYVLPSIPALALLVAGALEKYLEKTRNPLASRKQQHHWLIAPSAAMPIVIIALSIGMNAGIKNSSEGIVKAYDLQPDHSSSRLVFWPKRPFSGQFYSQGKAQLIPNKQQLMEEINNSGSDLYIAMKPKDKTTLPKGIQDELELIAKGPVRNLWKKKMSPTQSLRVNGYG